MNQYPMKTSVGGKIVRNCRLVVEDGQTTLWQWDRESDSAVVLLQSADGSGAEWASQKWIVGDLLIEPQRGCGCQHPMYTFVPPMHASR